MDEGSLYKTVSLMSLDGFESQNTEELTPNPCDRMDVLSLRKEETLFHIIGKPRLASHYVEEFDTLVVYAAMVLSLKCAVCFELPGNI